MPRRAIYPGTFDPITNGHKDLVRRAAGIFDEVVVAIAANPGKTPMFTHAERISLTERVLAGIPNVRITGYDGLTADFMREQGIHIVVRGLRAVSDFEYEFQMAGMNRKLYPEVETVFLTPADEYMFISATMVREIARLGGDIDKFVQPQVTRRLQHKFQPDR